MLTKIGSDKLHSNPGVLGHLIHMHFIEWRFVHEIIGYTIVVIADRAVVLELR